MEDSAETHLPVFLTEIAEMRRYSEQTVRAYRIDLRRFREFCGVQFAGHVKNIACPEIVGRFLAESRRSGDAPRTVARRASALRSFFKFLARKGLLAGDISDIFPSIKLPRPVPQYLTSEIMRKWFDSLPRGTVWEARDRALALVFYASGARLAEISGLKWDDIDPDRRQITVLGKRNKQRVIPVGDTAAEGLAEYKKLVAGMYGAERTDPGQPVFLNQRGYPLHSRSISRILNKCFRPISGGARLHPHLLRHTFATHMIDNGADVMAVKEFLGHVAVGTTQMYTHVSGEYLKKIYNRAFPRAEGENT